MKCQKLTTFLKNDKVIRCAKIFAVLLIVLIFVTVIVLAAIPNSPLLEGLLDALYYIEELPTVLSMIVMIEVGLFYSEYCTK